MKKVFLLLIIALAVLTVFVACEDDDYSFDVYVGSENIGSYPCKKNMTWEKFIDSDYNILGGFSADDVTGYIKQGDDYIYIDTTGLDHVTKNNNVTLVSVYYRVAN